MKNNIIDSIGGINRDNNAIYYVTFICVFVFNLILLVNNTMRVDPDIYWHIHIGEIILKYHQFPTSDTYSHTHTGKPWIAKEWLSQVILAQSYRVGGWFGVVLMTAASVALVFAILIHELMRRLDVKTVLPLVAFAFLCLAPTIVPRPHILVLPVMMMWFAILFRAAESGRPPPLIAALLMPIWANLHGSFIFGLGFGGLLVFESVLRAEPVKRPQVFMRWALFGLVSGLGVFIHPYGAEAVLAAKRVLDLGDDRRYIMEWNPSDFSTFSILEAAILFGIAAALATGYRLAVLRTVLLLLLLHMALAHNRHLAIFGLLTPLLLAPSLAARSSPQQAPPEQLSGFRPALLGCVTMSVATLIWSFIWPPEPIRNYAPEAALEAALASGVSGNVLNDYNFGGFLISRGVPTFIDGRTELFGGQFLKDTLDAQRLQRLDMLDEIIARYNISWTLLDPGSPAVSYLDRSSQWRRIHQDSVAVVHARK